MDVLDDGRIGRFEDDAALRRAAACRERDTVACGLEVRFRHGQLCLRFFERPAATGSVFHEAFRALDLERQCFASCRGGFRRLLGINSGVAL